MIKYVEVRFQGTAKKYQYLATMPNLKKGDRVVVEARNWYQIAIFEGYTTKNDIANRYLIGKLDLDMFEEDKKKIEEFYNLEEQIRERVEIVKERQVQEKLASEDRELAMLLDKRRAFSNI